MPLDEAFWSDESEQLLSILVPIIRQAALDGSEGAVKQLDEIAGVGVDWGVVNTDVQQWARTYSLDLVKGLTNTSRTLVQDAISEWTASGEPLDALITQLTPGFGPVRARMIASTEVTRAFHEGNLAVWKESDIVDGWVFNTAEDDHVCPICEPLDGQTFALSDQENAPPVHVSCRCWSQPSVKEPS